MNTKTVRNDASLSAPQILTDITYHPKNNSYYYSFLAQLYRLLIPRDSRVLHVGCRDGYLLNVVAPSFGVGIEYQAEFIEQARNRNPEYDFYLGLNAFQKPEKPFEYLIISASYVHSSDLQKLFDQIRPFCGPDTRLVLDWHAYGWEPLIALFKKLSFFEAEEMRNRLATKDVRTFLQLAGFEVISEGKGFIVPWRIPLVSWVFNKLAMHIPGVRNFGLLRWAVARPLQGVREQNPSVSVIITCRNERGTVEAAVQRCPAMGSSTELVFVEGHSSDGTLEELYRLQAVYPEKNIKVLVQPGIGKGDAVRAGFEAAEGDVLMILDADLTVEPEELPKFLAALVERRGDLINGSRLVYTMEPGAMRFLNFCANHFFAKFFSWITGQRVADTLCGTKVLYKKEYEKIAKNRGFFGALDPFGDFDLLFGAARLQHKIVDVPVHYKQRGYGTSQISRFRDGWRLLKMSFAALRKFRVIDQ